MQLNGDSIISDPSMAVNSMVPWKTHKRGIKNSLLFHPEEFSFDWEACVSEEPQKFDKFMLLE